MRVRAALTAGLLVVIAGCGGAGDDRSATTVTTGPSPGVRSAEHDDLEDATGGKVDLPEYTALTAGRIRYHCPLRPEMSGTLIARAPS